MTQRGSARFGVILLVISGGALWAWATHGNPGPPDQWIVLPIVLIAAAFLGQSKLLTHVSRSVFKRRTVLTVCVGLCAAAYFLITAVSQSSGHFPKYHDEFVYLTQAHMLAHGRLWMPPHPLVDFFDSEYLIVQPVYAAQYWPGNALLLAIGIWLHVPAWVESLVISTMVVSLFFWLAAELIGEELGLLAVMLLIAVGPFRHQSASISAFGATMLFGLLMNIAWLRWTQTRAVVWAIIFGVAAGWGAITRPIDAFCYALPALIAVVNRLIRQKEPARPIIKATVIAILAGLPFVALQLSFDVGVTGRWYEPPFVYYCKRDLPQVTIGFPKYDPTARPLSHLEQKQILYSGWVVPFVIAHQANNALHDWISVRVPTALAAMTPHPLLLVLVPLGILAACRSLTPVIWAPLPIFLVLYGCYTFFLPQYSMVVAPAFILVMVMGIRWVQNRWPGKTAFYFLPAVVLGLAISELPQLTRIPEDSNPAPSVSAAMDLPKFIHEPAVVLFRFRPWNNVHDEPVYNYGVAWPDEARIVRAHDLGMPKNAEIIRYYAQRQPQRVFYLLDEGDNSLHRMGRAVELEREINSLPHNANP